MNSTSLQEIGLHYLFQDTATIRSKIMEMHQTCTTNSQNSSQTLTPISFTMLKLSLRLLSTTTQVELLGELKTQITLKKSYNYRQLFSMSLRISNTLELQCHNCLMTLWKLWFLKAVVSSKRKSLTKQKTNSQKLSTSLVIPATSHTTFLFVIIK